MQARQLFDVAAEVSINIPDEPDEFLFHLTVTLLYPFAAEVIY
jgi:hypothetical protein